jgi:uncharacterized protein (TIGR02266 family)
MQAYRSPHEVFFSAKRLLLHESLANLELGDMADARKDKRTLLSLKIRYKSATLEDFIERYSGDISRGGVFIKAKKPLAVGTLLKFEFMLQDQSTLIHGVGRVVWRRDEAEADPHNPSGMGIKFIKMDPESRAVVQRIAEDRDHPGVFEQGKEGVQAAPPMASDPGGLAEEDRTKVRHVSEFLASALEEGGAGEAAKREAQAGVERARQISDQIGESRGAAARGAFSASRDASDQRTHSISDAPSRGAMSAFGGSGLSSSARMGSSAAPAMDELDAEDDFLDEETTKIQDLATSEFPDADATVISKDAVSPFAGERRRTPVVPTAAASAFEEAVPDLFGPAAAQSFGPAPGEFIDASLLDPGVPTVPPPSASVPEAPGIRAEAFKVPRAAEPVWTTRPTPEKKKVRSVFPAMFVLVLCASGVAAWQLGLTDGLMDLAAPYLGQSQESAEAPAQVAQPVDPTPQPEEATNTEAEPTEEAVAVGEVEPTAGAAPATDAAASGDGATTGAVKFQVVSRPVDAFVSVDGKAVGRTPLELEYEVGTQLSLFSKARGYLARRRQITVAADQASVSLVLAPLPYVVQVVTNPAGARASAVGGGEVITPGALRFKSMSGSRTIVVSMDGYKTASESVARADFIEEPRQMIGSINVTLVKDGAAAPSEATSSAETAAPPPKPAEPPPSEVTAEATPSAEPEAVEETPEPSETVPADAP